MRPMLHDLAKNWWLILLRGVCGIIFGVLTFLWPAISLVTLVLLYGAFAFADGLFALAAALIGSKGLAPGSRWWLALVGLLGIAAGLVTLFWPGVTAFVLLLFIAGWAIATGVLQIVGAVQLRKEIDNEWWLIASGALSVLFGLVLAFQPGVGALSLILVIGAFAIVYGAMLVMLALRLRARNADLSPP
jgi:uncharacterized membrane protein HdeD (DUF308 family)